jgi:UDP:flavonoid glycosyltransferase YjiC (YdhE family)
VFSTAALVGEAPEAGIELVGPSLGGVRGGESLEPGFGAGRPLVYVSFGSQAWHQPRRFEVLAAAAARLDVAMVMSMGDLAEAWAQRTPRDPHLRCMRHAAQLEVLRRAALLVSHGGANSVMEGLAAGVPVLVAPICNDQPHNRLFLERSGAGAGIDLDHAGVDAVCAAISALLDARSPVRAAAARVCADYAAHDGAAGAADLATRALP